MSRIHTATILERKRIADDALEISFSRPASFDFVAGQYIQVKLPNLLHADPRGSSRVFSIASSPNDRQRVSIAFRRSASGFKRSLEQLPLGGHVLLEGAHGFFTLRHAPRRPIVFVAGGIGITPQLSMIRFATEEKLAAPITLLYLNRSEKSAVYLDELAVLARRSTHLSIRSTFKAVDMPDVRQAADDFPTAVWHLAGPAGMVDRVRSLLSLSAVDELSVCTEEFVGY
ncbi:ferredoxin--NADP reductase [Georgenia yuyongxinii]